MELLHFPRPDALTNTPGGYIIPLQDTHRGYIGGIRMNETEKDIMNESGQCPCCGGGSESGRHTERSDEAKKKLIHRLNRIEGQIRGIRQMIENDAYCNDVLIQSAAAGAAINAFNRELIGAHLKGCVTRDLLAGREEVVDELLATLQKMMK